MHYWHGPNAGETRLDRPHGTPSFDETETSERQHVHGRGLGAGRDGSGPAVKSVIRDTASRTQPRASRDIPRPGEDVREICHPPRE